MKIFIGFREVAGYTSALARGFKEVGHHAEFCQLYPHPFYKDIELKLDVKLFRYALRYKCLKNFKRILYYIYKYIAFSVIFFKMVFSDLVIVVGRDSLARYFDFFLLKLLNKKIVVIFLGSDSRPHWMNGYYWKFSNKEMAGSVKKQKKAIELIERYAFRIICHPPAAQFLTKPFVPYLYIGFPLDYSRIKSADLDRAKSSNVVRILHAPSVPEAKGSDKIKLAITEIKKRRSDIEFIELIGENNQKVLSEIANADIIIDELYSDITMAGLSTEAAFFSKPSIVCGYVSSEDFFILDNDLVPPTCFSRPYQFFDNLLSLLDSKELRQSYGNRAKDFVELEWNPKKVVNRLLDTLKWSIKDERFCNPQLISYFHGTGIEESVFKNKITGFILAHGDNALQISDKSQLLLQLKKFIGD